MAKKKLQRFGEINTFPNVVQPGTEGWHFFPPSDYRLKGRWNSEHFGRQAPLVLELGCGKGEYTIHLAEKHPDKNFIGIDLKGNRIWRGAKTALEKKLNNAAFLRTQIEQIHYLFAPGEVSEIWITFPDPQPQNDRAKKRLTSPAFIERYRSILQKGGSVHLKTDHEPLYRYTLDVINDMGLILLDSTDDLYGSRPATQTTREEAAAVQTFYESQFLKEGKKICYLKFKI